MKLKFLSLCLLICALLCLASCSSNGDAFQQVEKNGCRYRVTYDLGNGTVNGNTSLLYVVAENALLPKLGEAQGTTAPILAGYRLTGYYTKSADGTEKDWNFATDRANSDLTLFARWEKSFTVQVLYGENNALSYSLDFSQEKPTLSTFRQVNWTGHTFYGFYYDAEYTKPVSFPYTHALDSANATETVYAKYLDGTFTVIRTPADFKGTINAGTMYYLDADLDLTETSLTVADTFSGAFYGNGHTIHGLHLSRKQTKNSENYGLFSQISASAVFQDITFEDVVVDVLLDNEQNTMIGHIGVFAGSVLKGAAFRNVAFSGTLSYDCAGRDLADKLVVGEEFGEDNGAVIEALTCQVSVTKAD